MLKTQTNFTLNAEKDHELDTTIACGGSDPCHI